MTEPTNKSEYAVGYKHPPAATQFKPGQSGNRKGRPKGAGNFSTALDKELDSLVPLTENGKRKHVRKRDLIAKQLVNKAATGDIKATALLISQTRGSEAEASHRLPLHPEPLAMEDQMVLSSILQRLHQIKAATPLAPSPIPESPTPDGDASSSIEMEQ